MPYHTGIRLLCVAQNPANGFPARLLEAYKAALGDFITERDGEGDDEKIAAQEEEREGEVE